MKRVAFTHSIAASRRREHFAQAAYNLDWFLFDTYNPYWEDVPDYLRKQYENYRNLKKWAKPKVRGGEKRYGYVA